MCPCILVVVEMFWEFAGKKKVIAFVGKLCSDNKYPPKNIVEVHFCVIRKGMFLILKLINLKSFLCNGYLKLSLGNRNRCIDN